VQYLQRVSRIRYLSRTYVVDVLIALLLIAAMLEVLVGRHSPGAPRTTLWFVLPAIAILVLPILARRRFPFAPAAHWLLAAGISFIDWRLIPFAISIFVVGLVAAFGTHPEWRYERAAEAAARCAGLLAVHVDVVTPPGHSTLVSFRPREARFEDGALVVRFQEDDSANGRDLPLRERQSV